MDVKPSVIMRKNTERWSYPTECAGKCFHVRQSNIEYNKNYKNKELRNFCSTSDVVRAVSRNMERAEHITTFGSKA
jgi:hypothetical protein